MNAFGRQLAVDRVKAGHPVGEVAKQLGTSRQTIYKWVRREAAEGPDGLRDRSSRPHTSPRRTCAVVVEKIRITRLALHAGPVALAGVLRMPASTVGAVVARLNLPLLSEVDRVTGQLVRVPSRKQNRYEHARPGDLLHVDVKKLGRIPPGGGWRAHGREDGPHHSGQGWDFVHVAVDDHSRVAYVEVHPDERALTCAAFLDRACTWFKLRGVTVRAVLTDNAKSYRVSAAWAAVCTARALKRRFTRPRHPWTNGKAERFNRTLLTEWAYSQTWTANTERTEALDGYVRRYNTERGHSALKGRPPMSRIAV